MSKEYAKFLGLAGALGFAVGFLWKGIWWIFRANGFSFAAHGMSGMPSTLLFLQHVTWPASLLDIRFLDSTMQICFSLVLALLNALTYILLAVGVGYFANRKRA